MFSRARVILHFLVIYASKFKRKGITRLIRYYVSQELGKAFESG